MFVVRDPNFLSTVHDVLQVLKLCEQLLVYYRLLQYHRPTASDFIFCRVAVGSRGKPNDVIATKWLLIKGIRNSSTLRFTFRAPWKHYLNLRCPEKQYLSSSQARGLCYTEYKSIRFFYVLEKGRSAISKSGSCTPNVQNTSRIFSPLPANFTSDVNQTKQRSPHNT